MLRLPLKTWLKAAVGGIVGALGFGGLAFGLQRFFDAGNLYMAPAWFFLPGTFRTARSEVLGAVLAGGGLPADVYILLVCAILFWTFVFGGVYLVWVLIKRSRAEPSIAEYKR